MPTILGHNDNWTNLITLTGPAKPWGITWGIFGGTGPEPRDRSVGLLTGKFMAGVVGFEPTVHATKKRCLTTWLHPNCERLITMCDESLQALKCIFLQFF